MFWDVLLGHTVYLIPDLAPTEYYTPVVELFFPICYLHVCPHAVVINFVISVTVGPVVCDADVAAEGEVKQCVVALPNWCPVLYVL